MRCILPLPLHIRLSHRDSNATTVCRQWRFRKRGTHSSNEFGRVSYDGNTCVKITVGLGYDWTGMLISGTFIGKPRPPARSISCYLFSCALLQHSMKAGQFLSLGYVIRRAVLGLSASCNSLIKMTSTLWCLLTTIGPLSNTQVHVEFAKDLMVERVKCC